MAMVSLGLALIFVFPLIFYGGRLREWAGTPDWNRTMVRPPRTIDAATGQIVRTEKVVPLENSQV